MVERLPHPGILPPAGYRAVGQGGSDRRLPGRTPRGGRAKPPRQRHALRPQLGRGPALPDALLRSLLLPRDRLRDRARSRPCRSGSPGPAQDPARLPAEPDLQRPLDTRAPIPRGGGKLRQPRARAAPARDARVDGIRPLSPDRQRPGLRLSPGLPPSPGCSCRRCTARARPSGSSRGRREAASSPRTRCSRRASRQDSR